MWTMAQMQPLPCSQSVSSSVQLLIVLKKCNLNFKIAIHFAMGKQKQKAKEKQIKTTIKKPINHNS